MGGDLNADVRAVHGVSRDVLDAERAKVLAEIADLERDRDARLADVAPEILQDLRRKRDELVRLDDHRAEDERRILRRCAPVGTRLLETLPPTQYLLRIPGVDEDRAGFLEQGVVGAIVAPPGAGKSMAIVQLGISVATGLPWLDRFETPAPGRVLLLCGEFTRTRADRRLQRLAAMMGILPEKAAELGLAGTSAHHARNARHADALGRNLFLEPLSGVDVSLQAADRDTPKETAFASELRSFLTDNAGPDGWRLVVLDTLARFGGPLVERDNFAADRMVRTLETLRDAPGSPTVLVIHHVHKGAMRGESDQGAARGSSALGGAVTWMLNLERVEQSDRVRLRLTKSNDGPPVSPMLLGRERFGFLRWLGDESESEEATTPNGSRRTRNLRGSSAADRASEPTNGERDPRGGAW